MTNTALAPPEGPQKWEPLALALRGQPGVWRRLIEVGPSIRSYAVQIKNGQLRPFRPAGHYEAMTSGGELWARYMGPPAGTGPNSP